jgi:hypothetical protein
MNLANFHHLLGIVQKDDGILVDKSAEFLAYSVYNYRSANEQSHFCDSKTMQLPFVSSCLLSAND